MAITTTSSNAKSNGQSNNRNLSTPSHQKVVKKDDKQRHSSPKVRTPSPKVIKKVLQSASTSETHFCSSVFFNSPDPSFLPMPIFDDDEVVNSKQSTSVLNIVNKTNTLRQFLNIRPSLATPTLIAV